MKHIIFCLLLCNFSYAGTDTVYIYAAASLSNVLPEVVKEFEKEEKLHTNFKFNFDASSKLAKQIESGSPADVFISADQEWMDYLATRNKVLKDTAINLLSNQMVIIVPVHSKNSLSSVKSLLDEQYSKIAVAGESVPAGKFARSIMQSEGVLNNTLIKKLVNVDNVRIALAWVAQNEVDAGFVYATDARIEPKVKIAYQFPDHAQSKIVYPAGVTHSSRHKEIAGRLIKFLKSKDASIEFKKAGFITL